MSKQFANQSSQVPAAGQSSSNASSQNTGGGMGNAFAAQQLSAAQQSTGVAPSTQPSEPVMTDTIIEALFSPHYMVQPTQTTNVLVQG